MGRLKRFRGHFFNWYDTGRSSSARAALHLVGRQRKSRGPSDRRRQRLRRRGAARLPTHRGSQPARATAWRSPARRCSPCPTTGARTSCLPPSSSAPSTTWPRTWRASWTSSRGTPRPPPTSPGRSAASADDAVEHRHAVLGRGHATVGRELSSRHRADRDRDRQRSSAGCRRSRRRLAPSPGRWSSPSCSIRTRRLLSIGYLCAEDRLDTNCYDLLASEARLASFVAIAKGDIPARHWFRLGREVTPVGRGAALVSWSGSMFEYLMPSLVMRAPRGSLIEKTNELIVQRQIDYAARPRPAVGHLRVGLQRPRQGIHLSVFQLRRAGPGLQARPERERRHRALCDRARRHGRSRRRHGQLRAAGGERRARRATASTRRSISRRHACPRARRRRSCAPTWRITRA